MMIKKCFIIARILSFIIEIRLIGNVLSFDIELPLLLDRMFLYHGLAIHFMTLEKLPELRLRRVCYVRQGHKGLGWSMIRISQMS